LSSLLLLLLLLLLSQRRGTLFPGIFPGENKNAVRCMDSPRLELLRAAASYRLFLVVLSVGSNLLLTDYDTSTPLLYFTSSAAAAASDRCWAPRLVASTFDRWDAVHFAGISTSGYVYEHNHAFYPGLPALAQGLSRGLARVLPDCDDRTVLILSFLSISHVSALLSVPVMYALSCKVLQSRERAKRATRLFIIQPSAPFTLAPYTEAPFTLLALSGMLLLEGAATGAGRGRRAWQLALVELQALCGALCFGLATCIRSNGLTLAGFLVVLFVRRLFPSLFGEGTPRTGGLEVRRVRDGARRSAQEGEGKGVEGQPQRGLEDEAIVCSRWRGVLVVGVIMVGLSAQVCRQPAICRRVVLSGARGHGRRIPVDDRVLD